MYSNLGRPYLVSAGIDSGVMTPLTIEIAATADFIQTDITYDHMQCYKYMYLLHEVAKSRDYVIDDSCTYTDG